MNLPGRLLCASLLTAAAQVFALDVQPYTAQMLAALQSADKPVALHFHADWCPTCRAQDKAIGTLKADPALDMTLLTVDYDTEKALKRDFNVRAQSTLVVMHGKRETARLVGDTSAVNIRAALKSAL
jgi:thioredoxin 1